MGTEITPGGMVCLGYTKAAWLPNLTFYPRVTADDFAAPGAMNVSFFMMMGFGLVFADGRWQIRGCKYITDPQNPDDGVTPLLKPGQAGYFAFRYGRVSTADWSVLDIVNLMPCVLGPRSIGASSDDEYGKFIYDQPVFASGPPMLGVEVSMSPSLVA